MSHLEPRLPSRSTRWTVFAGIVAAVLASVVIVSYTDTAEAASATSLSSGTDYSCAVTDSGSAMCWGLDTLGQLGTGSDTAPSLCSDFSIDYECSRVPVQVAGLESGVEKVDAGDEHACALLTSGGVKCWGRNDRAQLGSGALGPETCATPTLPRMCSNTPVDVFGLQSGVEDIDAGGAHTCALLTGGGMKCWGLNDKGQLGAISTNDCGLECSLKPLDVTGLTSGVLDISVGSSHTCAVTGVGAAMCWGYNSRGQLGDGSIDDSGTPVQVVGLTSGVDQIAADLLHTCARVNGATKCWGDNRSSQLAQSNGSSDCTLSADDCYVPSPINVSASGALVAVGGSYTCAGGGSTVQCWGANVAGALGNGMIGPDDCGVVMCSIDPVFVDGLARNVIALAPGAFHNCALLEDGGVQCWGENSFGNTGNGSTSGENELSPVYTTGFTGSGTVPTPTETPGPQTEMWGDTTCEGDLNPPDVTRILAYIVTPGNVPPAADCPDVGEDVTLLALDPQGAGTAGVGTLFTWGDWHCNDTIDPSDALNVLYAMVDLADLPSSDDCPKIGDNVTFE